MGGKAGVELLLGRGADINRRDPQGRLAVQLAMSGDEASMVKYLLSLGASSDWTYTDMQDTQGWTPLHWACRNGDVDTVQLLIDSGADLQNENMQLWTPLDVATFSGNGSLAFTLSRLQGSTGTEMKQKILAPGYEHDIGCYSCFFEICGPCYQCKDCREFFLCFRCIEDAAVIHDSNHTFNAIEEGDVDGD
ncbi:ankyrin [Hyaloscypha bicolor E]|uniref:Ankyrin n=1 Tax=Hyaloscypha bicolor E TaxID=1095630 RepID=A0A2J6SKE2_9HELO|nr:ankyrin [Hyaloscypha bicolor E]PMD51213.1 ankyrin [Hyaloscypha bicolor E]